MTYKIIQIMPKIFQVILTPPALLAFARGARWPVRISFLYIQQSRLFPFNGTL